MPPNRLRLASYNVHRCVGREGKASPERVAGVLRELDADLVGLQEVLSGQDPSVASQLAELAAATGLTPVAGHTLVGPDGPYGNALLTRLPVIEARRHDLGVPGLEPRGALEVTLAHAAGPLRVVVTHLGLRRRERARQVKGLLERVLPGRVRLLCLMGDANEWRTSLLRPALGRLDRVLGPAPRAATFPAHRPLLSLDRIWPGPAAALQRLWAHRTDLSRVASDHLPVVADLGVREDATPGAGPRSQESGS